MAETPAALSQSQYSPKASAVHPRSAMHNTRVIGSIATLTSCFAGLVAGILGLQNYIGFALYFVVALITGVTTATLKCGGDVGRYAAEAHASAGPLGAAKVESWRGWLGVCGLGSENLLAYLLFWIGGNALVHVYD